MNAQAKEGFAAGLAFAAIAIKREKEAKARQLLEFGRRAPGVLYYAARDFREIH